MKVFLSLSVICMLLFGCTRKVEEKSKLTLKLPTNAFQEGVVSKAVEGKAGILNTAGAPPWDTTLNPTTAADVNCYAVFVGGPEPFMNINSCADTSSGETRMRFGPNKGFFPAGSVVNIEVPSGPDRKIFLAGVKAQPGSCGTLDQPDFTNMSLPHILAEKVVTLAPGDVAVDMNATISITRTFDTCDFIAGPGGGGPPPEPLFGDGSDGDLSIDVGTNYELSSIAYNNANFSHSGGIKAAAKKFHSLRRVFDITDSDKITVEAPVAITPQEFEVGDEILWAVIGGSTTGPPPDPNACGGDLNRGDFSFAKITSIGGANSNEWTLDRNITENLATVNHANIQSPTASFGTDFCRIQIVRVPNFDTLTVAAAGTIFDISPLSLGLGKGGIISFRAKHLVLTDSLDITVIGRGYKGGGSTEQGGEGLRGTTIGSSTSSQENGGGAGPSGNGGGGGSNQGIGGVGEGGGPGDAGNQLNYCAGSTTCLPIADKKIFMGGGGGSGASGGNFGGAGGGIVILHIEKISGPGALTVYANGNNGQGSSEIGGGGAGGMIHMTSKEIISTGAVSFFAEGGAGTGGTNNGGGGGGGSIELPFCSALTTASTPIGSVAGGASANPGGAGVKVIVDEPAICASP